MSTTAKTAGPDFGRKGLFRGPDGKNLLAIFALVTTLFLLWGFCNGLIDVLNKHFQSTLHINKFQSGFVQSANYMAYFLMAIPAGLLARRYGYKGGILIGLSLIIAGALWFVAATQFATYAAFLAGLFILATGMTCLETVANPYTTVLGPVEKSAARINIAQTFNGVGWILGPVVGGTFIFEGAKQANHNSGILIPYLGIAVVVAVLLIIFSVSRLPDLQPQEAEGETTSADKRSLIARPRFTLGVLAQFLYVAAQSGIFAYFINYVIENEHVTEFVAKDWLGYFGFGLFMVGRLCGSAVVSFFKAHQALALYAAINVVLCGLAVLGGNLGYAAVLGTFFFMSIMFPTIFALSIRGLGEHTKLGSSLVVMSIVGGAIVPPLMGHIADVSSMRIGFLVPAACFVLIACYGAMWPKLER